MTNGMTSLTTMISMMSSMTTTTTMMKKNPLLVGTFGPILRADWIRIRRRDGGGSPMQEGECRHRPPNRNQTPSPGVDPGAGVENDARMVGLSIRTGDHRRLVGGQERSKRRRSARERLRLLRS